MTSLNSTPAKCAGEIVTVDGLASLANRYDAILCDVWGVLIDGAAHFPRAAAALKTFRAQGGSVALITNASRPSEEVRGQLRRLGVPDDCYDDLVSAGELTLREIVARKGQACCHLGPPRDRGLFETAGRLLGAPLRLVEPEAADYVVCTGLVDEDHETPEDYDARLHLLRDRALPMLCANPDIVVGVGDRLYWCAGALAQRYEAMGGETHMFGKPHPPIYRAALQRLTELHGPIRGNAFWRSATAPTRIWPARAALALIACSLRRACIGMNFTSKETLDLGALDILLVRAKTTPVALAREVVW